MKWKIPSRRPSHGEYAALCFFAGILIGSLWLPLSGASCSELIQPELATVLPEKLSTLPGGPTLGNLLLKRLLFAGFLWLLGMSLVAAAGMSLFLFWCGCSMALFIAALTVQRGCIGLPLFVLLQFPQMLCYLPAVLVLVGWGFGKPKKLHLAGFLVLLFLMAVGAILEVWVCPRLLSLMLGRFI